MPLVATPSWKRWLLVALGCAALVAVGVLMLSYPRDEDLVKDLVGGWLSIVLGGFGTVVALAQFLGTHQTFRIDDFGITWTQRSDQTIPWSAITDLEVLTISHQSFLAASLTQPDAYPPRRKPLLPITSLNKRIYGGDVHIPISMLDASSKQVLAALDQYRPPRDR
jgi:hypothetical protein